MKIVPAKKLEGKVVRTLASLGGTLVSTDVDALELSYGGVKGDRHEGLTRPSNSREPWYKKGTEMRNEQQVSIVSVEELAEIASDLGVEKIEGGWIGANLVFEGIPNMTRLPPRTLLMFEGGVTLRVDGYRGPCRYSGGSIAAHCGMEAEDHNATAMAFDFVKAAYMKRGLVAWVEREGEIRPGETFTARIWEQWIYE
ncbi:MAG: MOSC domain-containing protein [Pseudomonadota bacterium]